MIKILQKILDSLDFKLSRLTLECTVITFKSVLTIFNILMNYVSLLSDEINRLWLYGNYFTELQRGEDLIPKSITHQ
jgi:hypothetical protein